MTVFWRVCFAACCVIGAALAHDAAEAHSKQTSSMPADGAVLDAAPEMIGMTFDRPIRITFIRLTDEAGAEVPLDRDDAMAAVLEFAAAPEALAPGRYVVEWRGLSEDGHPMEGAFSFEVKE